MSNNRLNFQRIILPRDYGGRPVATYEWTSRSKETEGVTFCHEWKSACFYFILLLFFFKLLNEVALRGDLYVGHDIVKDS